MRGARLALLATLAACARSEEPGSRELYELERLVFVPPAACTLWPNTDLSLRTALVFDRFEFTRADLRHYGQGRTWRSQALTWSTDAARDDEERGDWPAFVDFDEAEALAALRGMRLPTPTEWLHVAVGRRGYPNPWGGAGREFFANTVVLQDGEDFSLKSPCDVGTFENGRSRPFGCYDLLGNVWEWGDGVVPGFEPTFPEGGEDLDDGAGTKASVLGGAFDTLWRPTFELDRRLNRQRFHARLVDKKTLSPSIGARMCADAERYLWWAAPRWGSDAKAARRVSAVGREWSKDDSARAALRALLADLRARPDAPPALAWLEQAVLSDS